MPVDQTALDEIALTRAEYEAIVDRLGREPGPLELGLFGALWSEHCGYKHTRPLLRTLPTSGSRLLVAVGAENAGVIDIGDGMAIAMKVESHNHPSAVEPYQGAATGVGGIVRDIFAMGARPIALLNSLRFGPLDEPRNLHLFHGVIEGISGYGNCIGVPDVGGEIAFEPCYSGNPLVNAMCVGLIEDGRIVSARARRPGDRLLLVGADTGRDGIHGASGLASRTFEDQAEMRSAVQVGNPFLEKILIEACLEASRLDSVVGMQDLGAAGLTSAAIEMAERSGLGLRIDISRIPRREEAMSAYEVMLSESQERMLLVLEAGREDEALEVFRKWDLDATLIGEFVGGHTATIADGERVLSETPVETLTDAPVYEFNAPRPGWLAELQSADLEAVALPKDSPADVLLALLGSPNIASRRPVFRQYDHQVQTNTVIAPGEADAAVLRLKGSKRGIAVTIDGNGRLCYLDPYAGAAIAVAEACRNLACVGATPIAITDGLNFGNPETAVVQYQLGQAVDGIKAACEEFGIPVVSGNASLYNETRGEAIYPTPVIGALGLMDDVTRHANMAIQRAGERIVLLGPGGMEATPDDLAGSEYLALVHSQVAGRPSVDLEHERRLQMLCAEAIGRGLVSSAHDCSEGGLAVAIAESSIAGGIGARVELGGGNRWDALLFGERQGRIVLTLPAGQVGELAGMAGRAGVQLAEIGETGGDRIMFNGLLDISLRSATNAWEGGLARASK